MAAGDVGRPPALLPGVDELGGEVLTVVAILGGPGEIDPGFAVIDEHHVTAAGVFSVFVHDVGEGGGAVGADAQGEAGGGVGAVDGHGGAVGAAGDDLAELGDLPGDGNGGGTAGAEGEAVGLGNAFFRGDRARAFDVELPGAVPRVGAGGLGWRELGGGGEGEGGDEGEGSGSEHERVTHSGPDGVRELWEGWVADYVPLPLRSIAKSSEQER